jgi:GTPase-activating protein SAC7
MIGVHVHGIFQDRGAPSRVRELRQMFDTPDRYGKGINWVGYTVHDAVGVLLLYLETLPEPTIPFDAYESFREVPLGSIEGSNAITVYQDLIRNLPSSNRQLLLYLLDAASHLIYGRGTNGLSAPLMASILQRAVLHHPDHESVPAELSINRTVLDFLIESINQFLNGPAPTTK